ncbi:DUF2085 domain-containing protein [Archangium sp.]|uniref:DUF2085 domain-containing protein n=1 Tax=Archangium sp. TaxID=1872627 RepID=UPI00286A487B|nr:DUF2085 domain-containing protein [Archangium sp.]
MFWLSHHHEDEYNRTYLLGGVRVCARCLGTYPVLVAVMMGLFALRAPLAWPWDVPVVLGLTLPALVDWAVGRFRPASGTNTVRTLTGVLLGAALGRSLFVHLQKPLPPMLVWQGALVLVVALPVLFLSSRGSRNG